MSKPAVSLATLAPPPPPPVPPQAPTLAPAPPDLRQGGAGLGPLPPAPPGVDGIPRKFLLAGAIPLGIAVVLTVAGQIPAWPGTPEAYAAAMNRRAAPTPVVPTQPPPTQQRKNPRPTPQQPAPRPQAPPAAPVPASAIAAADAGQPVWYLTPGVTAPVPLTAWPRVNPGPRYADHIAQVTVRFVVGADGTVDPASLKVSGPGAGPLTDATVAAYRPMRFQPGRLGSRMVAMTMEHSYRYPPN